MMVVGQKTETQGPTKPTDMKSSASRPKCRMAKPTKGLLLWSAFFAANLACAQSTDEVIKLSPFEISDSAKVGYGASETASGSRVAMKLIDLPQTINVVTSELIDDMAAADPVEAMTKISPGVTSFSGNLGTNVTIRGFRAQNWAIDGATSRYTSLMDNFLFDSLEVIKGPSTLLFGPFGSFGGYVNASAKYARHNHVNKIQVGLGTDNYYSALFDVGGELLSSNVMPYRLVIGTRSTDRPGVDHDFNEYTVISPSVAYDISPTTQLKLRFEYIDSTSKLGTAVLDVNGNLLPEFSSMGPLKLTEWNAENLGAQAILTSQLAEGWNLRLNLFLQKLKDDPIVGGATLAGTSLAPTYNFQPVPHVKTQDTVYADVSVAWKLEGFGPDGSMDNDLVIGAEVNYWRVNNELYDTNRYPEYSSLPLDPLNPDWSGYELTYPYPTRYTDYNVEWLGGGFIQNNLSMFHRKMIASFGVKYNYDGRSNLTTTRTPLAPEGEYIGTARPYTVETLPTYRYGLIYKPTENMSIFAGHTESYVSGAGSNRKADGSFLDSQTGANDEVGVKIDFPNIGSGVLSGSVSYFQTEVVNMWRADPFNPGYFVQDGFQENNGFEAQITYGSERFSGIVGVYSSDGPFTVSSPGSAPSRAVGAPKLTYNFWGKYRFSDSFEAGGGYRYQDDTISGVAGFATEGYGTADLFVSYFLKLGEQKVKLHLSADNITDERGAYRLIRPSTVYVNNGRSFKLTATYTW